ncbi:hypothetical protein [Amycolatopsis pithecellobii]|uniref:Uncharacterized protein n=1 Tax=Amycolatopsis pithecellobii TaxID=664692 RepID=A0A6N7Z4Z3_9PSEU|nr:hypothetical protein [Amycolatopsis pithecellobii]MTD57263.1 hypothetical protein [Amycolatopsis pithecellobii]
MTQEHAKHRSEDDDDQKLGPDFPRLRHPDLDVDKTDEVEDVPNREDVPPPGEQVPEPPD